MKTQRNQLSRRRTQSRRRGGSVSSRRRQFSRRRGGSFYPYNTKPMIFTNTTTQQGGDARNTFFPSFITNMGRDAAYQVGQTYNAFVGNYPSVNPTPTHQKLLR
jgi:hypothetical protein